MFNRYRLSCPNIPHNAVREKEARNVKGRHGRVAKHNLVHPLFAYSHWNLLNKPPFRTKHYSSHRFCLEWNYLPPPPTPPHPTSWREAWLPYWLICVNGYFFCNTVPCWVKGVNLVRKWCKEHTVPERQHTSSLLKSCVRKTNCYVMELNFLAVSWQVQHVWEIGH